MIGGGTAPTRRLMEEIGKRMTKHLSLLERLVDIPSHASVIGGTDLIAGELIPHLEALGFSVETFAQRPVADELRWVEEIMIPGQRQQDLGPTYRAVREAEDGRVLLLGDLDTAYPLTAHEVFHVRREGSLFYTPGIADMKGGLVVLIASLQALQDAGVPSPSIEVVLSGDEQAGSLGSRHVIEESAARCGWTLCVECARRGGQLMAARGHIGIGDLTAHGVESHAGSAYEEGVNAIHYLARVIPLVNGLAEPEKGVLVTVTMVEAGRRRSVIPGRARAILDIRTPSTLDWDTTIRRIHETVVRFGEGRVEARVFNHRPGVPWSTEADQLLGTIGHLAADIGVPISAFRSAAAGSSAFAGAAGSVVMDGMGPVGGGLMTEDEHIDIGTIAERAAILAATIASLVGASPPERS